MYKIGSFNCLNLGVGASKDIQTFADIIKNEKFDIVALQEIKGQKALDRILAWLPGYWEGVADNECYVNDYAFVWNTRRVQLANAEEKGLDRVYSPRIYKQYKINRKEGQTDLIREPFYARFFPCGGSAPYIEIRLINTHIRFSKGEEGEQLSLGAVAMRKNEFDVLVKSIYVKEADKRYGNNRPAYTFLLGDYNLNSPSSTAAAPYLIESYEIADGDKTKIITTVQSELSTLKKKTDDAIEKDAFANNYDHFTYDVERFSGVVISCGRVDSVEKYYNGDVEKHTKMISDHVPVSLKFNMRR